MRHLLMRVPSVPLCFTGMGVFRVWTETVYFDASMGFPTHIIAGSGFFDLVAITALLLFAALSRYISPLQAKGWAHPLTAVCLVFSASFNFLSAVYPHLASVLAFPAAVLGGIGIALIILLWSEFFGCLNPLRIGLYFSAGIILSTLILWLFKGLAFGWLWVCTCLIPIISLVFLRQAYRQLSPEERPHKGWGAFLFPWKPICIVALYSFAYGLCTYVFTGYLGLHSGFGGIGAAVLFIAGICLFREPPRFSAAFKLALPFMLMSLIPFGSIIPFGNEVSAFCALASYTLCLIIIMVILGNLVYQYGANALWLFGIERAIRLLSVQGGIRTRDAVMTVFDPLLATVVLPVLVAILIVAATAMLFSEKQLSSTWGLVLKDAPNKSTSSYLERNRLGLKCQELAKRFALTQREVEILLLLAQDKSSGDIAHKLFVALSTVKTHIKHIYQKLGIHSRRELYEILGIQPRRMYRTAREVPINASGPDWPEDDGK